MIAGVLLFTSTAFLIGAAGLHRANRRSAAAKRRARWLKLGGYFAVVHSVLLCALLGSRALGALFSLVAVAGGSELVRAQLGSTSRPSLRSRIAVLSCYAVLSTGLVTFALSSPPVITVYVYLVVAAFDGFSQVVGETLGSHRLAPRVSPNKTAEGALGGLFAAVSTGLLLRSLPQLGWVAAAVASGLTGAAALGGDLMASSVKRRSGIKDFGALLPGQGGVLDRFDSLLLAGSVAQVLSGVILR